MRQPTGTNLYSQNDNITTMTSSVSATDSKLLQDRIVNQNVKMRMQPVLKQELASRAKSTKIFT